MTKKEETSTSTSTFSSFEYHILVKSWMQRLIDCFEGQLGQLMQSFKCMILMKNYCNISLDLFYLIQIHLIILALNEGQSLHIFDCEATVLSLRLLLIKTCSSSFIMLSSSYCYTFET